MRGTRFHGFVLATVTQSMATANKLANSPESAAILGVFPIAWRRTVHCLYIAHRFWIGSKLRTPYTVRPHSEVPLEYSHVNRLRAELIYMGAFKRNF